MVAPAAISKYPLSTVYVQYKELDVDLVEPVDKYSQCVAGFDLSLDPLSAVSVGQCLIHMKM